MFSRRFFVKFRFHLIRLLCVGLFRYLFTHCMLQHSEPNDAHAHITLHYASERNGNVYSYDDLTNPYGKTIIINADCNRQQALAGT